MGIFSTNIQSTLLCHLHNYIFIPLIIRLIKRIAGDLSDSNDSLLVHFTPTNSSVLIGTSKNGVGRTLTRLLIHSPIKFSLRMIANPRLGFAESYMYSEWDADPSPKSFLNFLIRAKRRRGKLKPHASVFISTLMSIANYCANIFQFFAKHFSLFNYAQQSVARLNTLHGSRKNIREHYDLGNDLFRTFLDESMTYSCAIFQDFPKVDAYGYYNVEPSQLYEAQLHKYDVALEKMGISSGDEVLELGCGWGSLSICAAKRFNCKWTGLTISHAQLEYAKRRVVEVGLAERVNLKFLDYREEYGLYDHVIAIEMIEAVGHEYLSTFFEAVSRRLKGGGKLMLQAIVCRDSEYDRYRRSEDFIKKHIFPGGHMPSLGAIRNALPSDLKIKRVDRIGQHYSPTLDAWCSAWLRSRHSILEMGYSTEFFRKWEMYFSMCSSLFLNGNIDAVHILIEKSS